MKSATTIAIDLRPATVAVGSVSGLPGTYVTFPVTFTPSPDLAAGVACGFNVNLPIGVSFSSVTAGPVAIAAGDSVNTAAHPGDEQILIVGFNLNTYGAGDLADITLSISPSAPAGSIPLTLSNVQFNNVLGDILIPTNVTTGTLTVLGSANLTLTKSASVANAQSGNTVTFTIQYQNTGSGIAASSVITDPVPSGTTLVPNSIFNGGTLSGSALSGYSITWNLGTVAAGASGSVSFQVTVN
jgi:large repetitive protein